MSKNRYFDRNGNETDEHSAFHNGALRDGYRLLVPSRFRDDTGSEGVGSRGQQLGVRLGSPCTKDGYSGHWVLGSDGEPVCDISKKDSAMGFTDGSGNIWSASRPGFRVRTGDKRQVTMDAVYDAYNTRLSNSFKLHDGETLCSSCNGSGVDLDGSACVDCNGSGTKDTIYPPYENSVEQMVYNTTAPNDSRPLAQRVQDHRRTMDALYAQRDRELSEAWRNK